VQIATHTLADLRHPLLAAITSSGRGA